MCLKRGKEWKKKNVKNLLFHACEKKKKKRAEKGTRKEFSTNTLTDVSQEFLSSLLKMMSSIAEEEPSLPAMQQQQQQQQQEIQKPTLAATSPPHSPRSSDDSSSRRRRRASKFNIDPPPSLLVRAIEKAIKCACYAIVIFYVGKAFHRNVFNPLLSLSNADYSLKTIVRDVFYGYEKPKNRKAASSVRDIEHKKKLLADESHLKRKLEHRDRKRQKLHEKLGLNHEDEMEIWRRKSEEMKRSNGRSASTRRDDDGEL